MNVRVYSVFRGFTSRFVVSALFTATFFAVISGFAADGPKIQFASTILDFGRVDSGQMIKHSFTFTNSGDQLLEIKDVRPSCGCTTAGAWERLVEPGKTGNIPVQFNSEGYRGDILKTVIVLSNDPSQTNVVLQIKGTIWKPIDVTPPFAMFTPSADAETNETRSIHIVNNMDGPLTLSEPACTNDTFQATLKTVRPGKEFELQVALTQPLRSTNAASTIILKTSATNTPVIAVTAIVAVQPVLVTMPSQINLPSRLPNTAVPVTLSVRNNSARPLALSEPTINAEGVEIRVQEIQPGRLFSVTATLPAGFRVRAGESIELRVKTNHPQFPILKVPLIQGEGLAATLSRGETSPPPTATSN